MENKYYQPNAEDFNIGVECQVYYPREEVWKDRKIRHWEDLDEILSRFVTDNTSVRFKYLDEDDFLDLGFIFYGRQEENKLNQPVMMFHSDSFNLMIGYYYKINKLVTATKDPSKNKVFSKTGQDPNRIAGLKIKNKNEFQRLLKQLEIDAL